MRNALATALGTRIATVGYAGGRRSAYSRTGGAEVYCYASEVPASKLPIAREYGATLAPPPECGGAGDRQILDY